MTFHPAAACALALGLLGSTLAHAQAPTQGPGKEIEQACADDVIKLCPKVQPGQGRVAECLKAHKQQVSIGCKLTLYKAKQSAAGGAPR